MIPSHLSWMIGQVLHFIVAADTPKRIGAGAFIPLNMISVDTEL
jgi:hypothetical protein